MEAATLEKQLKATKTFYDRMKKELGEVGLIETKLSLKPHIGQGPVEALHKVIVLFHGGSPRRT